MKNTTLAALFFAAATALMTPGAADARLTPPGMEPQEAEPTELTLEQLKALAEDAARKNGPAGLTRTLTDPAEPYNIPLMGLTVEPFGEHTPFIAPMDPFSTLFPGNEGNDKGGLSGDLCNEINDILTASLLGCGQFPEISYDFSLAGEPEIRNKTPLENRPGLVAAFTIPATFAGFGYLCYQGRRRNRTPHLQEFAEFKR